jgi:hypothetical protein
VIVLYLCVVVVVVVLTQLVKEEPGGDVRGVGVDVPGLSDEQRLEQLIEELVESQFQEQALQVGGWLCLTTPVCYIHTPISGSLVGAAFPGWLCSASGGCLGWI